MGSLFFFIYANDLGTWSAIVIRLICKKATVGSSWSCISMASHISAHCLFFLLSPSVQFIIVALESTVVSRLALNVCDKKEHSVDILLRKDHLSLRVDGIVGESELSTSELEDSLSILENSLQSTVKTYVGGLPGEHLVLYHGLQTRSSPCWAASQENCLHSFKLEASFSVSAWASFVCKAVMCP